MSLLAAFRRAAAPAVAVEFAATHVSAARLEWRAGQATLAAHAVEALPAGALVASLTGTNLANLPAVRAALGRVLDAVGRPQRLAVVVPDLAAKVSLLTFEQVPPRAEDLDRLIRWQVRKAVPFPIDEAQLSYVPGDRGPTGQEFLVSLAHRRTIEEYEAVVAAEGAQAGLVDLATFNVVNAVLAGSAELSAGGADWLLVNVVPDGATLVILRGQHVVLFRNRAAGADDSLADLVHQTAMYYQDRLGGTGFARVVLAGSVSAGGRHAHDVDIVRHSLQERLAANVDALDLRATMAFADHIGGSKASLDALAPLVGVLLRGSEEAA